MLSVLAPGGVNPRSFSLHYSAELQWFPSKSDLSSTINVRPKILQIYSPKIALGSSNKFLDK